MKLLLRADIEHLGKMGDVIAVADGYARNYLLPRRLAVVATPENERRIEAEKQRRQMRLAAQSRHLEETARKLDGRSVTIQTRANEEDHLYGSVTEADIVAALERDEGVHIEPRQVVLEEPLRKLGVYEVKLALAEGTETAIKVWIISDDSEPPDGADEKIEEEHKEEQ